MPDVKKISFVKKFSSLNEFDLLEGSAELRADAYVFRRKDKEIEELSIYTFRLNVSGSFIKQNLEFFFSLMKDTDVFIFYEKSGAIEIAFEKGKKESLISNLQLIAQTLEKNKIFPRSNFFKDNYFLVMRSDRNVTHPFPNLPMLDCSKVVSEEGTVSTVLDFSGTLTSEIDSIAVSGGRAEQNAPLNTQKKIEEQSQSFLSGQKIPATFFMKLVSNIKVAVLLCAGLGVGVSAFLFFGWSCLPVLGAFTTGLTVGFFTSSARKNDKKESELENKPLVSV